MAVFVRRNGKIARKESAENRPWTISIISDSMQPLRHMGTGRVIDSKSNFRADTKASGCVELGTDKPKQRTPIKLDRGQRRDAIRRSLYEHRNS